MAWRPLPRGCLLLFIKTLIRRLARERGVQVPRYGRWQDLPEV
jgi:hypothetical protein